jgi:hypothetical protein
VQHHVVRTGDGDHERAPGGAEQQRQRVGVVAVDLGVVGVADVHAHRQAEQLAAEVVLQAAPDHLLAVVEVLRADEADHGVDQQRAGEAARGAVIAGLRCSVPRAEGAASTPAGGPVNAERATGRHSRVQATESCCRSRR